MVEGLVLQRHDDIAELVLDRPAKRNAISFEMWAAIPDVVAEVDADDTVKLLVVRGAGDHFSAGADISEFETRRARPADAEIYNEGVERAERSLVRMRKPSLAVIHGYCIGGGCELALACDLRFAATDAQLGITPAKLGIVYSFVSTRQLVAAVGASYAKYLLFSGVRVGAAEGLRAGLVDQVAAGEDLDRVAAELAATVCSRSQVSVQGSKRIINEIAAGATTATDDLRLLPLEAMEREDYREGVRAFLEKRPARFVER